jgi:hypothetical protein
MYLVYSYFLVSPYNILISSKKKKKKSLSQVLVTQKGLILLHFMYDFPYRLKISLIDIDTSIFLLLLGIANGLFRVRGKNHSILIINHNMFLFKIRCKH